jgi:hypothetical protein
MTVVIFGVAAMLIITLGVAVLILVLARGDLIWQRDEARKERDVATCKLHDARAARAQADHDLSQIAQQRDTAIHAVNELLSGQDDTVRLPRWTEFLPAQPGLPADTVAEVLEALERHANGEGR